MKINNLEIEDVKTLLDKLASYGTGHAFRGQMDSTWDIKNGIERLFPEEMPLPELDVLKDYEKLMLKKFKSNAHLYESFGLLPEKESTLGWLALMQHHGTPTRLIDLTTMPFMALYFSIDGVNSYSKKFSSIYCISHREINNISSSELAIKTSIRVEDVKGSLSNGDDFYEKHIKSHIHNLVWCLEPARLNLRIRQQGGTFIVHDDMRMRFEQAIISNPIYRDITIDKIIFPHKIVPDIFILLTKMGITNKQIYPGLDGLSKDIKQEMIHYIFRAIRSINPNQ